jgi:hypothetical protein
MPNPKSKPKTVEFDSPWKDILERYFPAFIDLFYPTLYAQIDWSKGVKFLDQELTKVVREAVTKQRRVDKLAEVHLLNGQKTLLYIHVDVQSQVEATFDQRMFIYQYRLYDRYGDCVMSLAILGDNNKDWRPNSYQYDNFGCKVSFEFPIVKLLDYKQPAKWAELERSPNPFAYVVRVHLKALETQKQPLQRLKWKQALYQELCQANYRRQEILELFRFLDWVFVLPKSLTQKFNQFVSNYEEKQKVRYISSIEQMALDKGMKQGVQQGLQQGVQQGVRDAVVKVLRVRFKRVPKLFLKKINLLQDPAKLSQLLEEAVLVKSLSEFEPHLD